jgi:hypothetical protein
MRNTDTERSLNKLGGYLETWIDGVTPLVLEAFAIYLTVNQCIVNLVREIPLNGSGPTLQIVIISMSMGALTFAINMVTLKHIRKFVCDRQLGDVTLFRSVWVFICAHAITPFTETTGIMPFAIVTVIPFVYIRVNQHLAACSAVYALIFLFFVVRNSFVVEEQNRFLPEGRHPQVYHIIMHLSVFVASVLYHIAWFASHKYTPDTAAAAALATTATSSRLVRWRHSTTPLSALRASIVILCSLSGRYGFSDDVTATTTTINYNSAAKHMRILFLFITISTFTAWTHCQHQHKRRFQHILSASVVTSAIGFLVSNIEQIFFAWSFFYIVTFLDVFYTPRPSIPKIHAL